VGADILGSGQRAFHVLTGRQHPLLPAAGTPPWAWGGRAARGSDAGRHSSC
jgi:hypothetical protein